MLKFVIAFDALRIPGARLGNHLMMRPGYMLGEIELVPITEDYPYQKTKGFEATRRAEALATLARDHGIRHGGAYFYIGVAAAIDPVLTESITAPSVRQEIAKALNAHGSPAGQTLLNGQQIGRQVRDRSVSYDATDHSPELFLNMELWLDELRLEIPQ